MLGPRDNIAQPQRSPVKRDVRIADILAEITIMRLWIGGLHEKAQGATHGFDQCQALRPAVHVSSKVKCPLITT